MAEPIFNGIVVATNRDTGSAKPPEGHGLDLAGSFVCHRSGAYIRFSEEGDIFIVPAPGRAVTAGKDTAG